MWVGAVGTGGQTAVRALLQTRPLRSSSPVGGPLQSPFLCGRRLQTSQSGPVTKNSQRGSLVMSAKTVRFNVHAPTQFGEEVVVVGGTEVLGSWEPARAPRMEWTEGHIWRLSLDLPETAGGVVEYKYALHDGSRARTGQRIIWQEGNNHTLKLADAPVEVHEEWLLPERTLPKEEPPQVGMPQGGASVSQRPPPGTPPPVQQSREADRGAESGGGGVPAWFRRAVVYHIQSLGFFGVEGQPNNGTAEPSDRLSLIRNWYDHFEALGINTIYFGPLMESGTHGYDTADYYAVDRRLGTVEEFRAVVGELQARGLRVLLDGVFNHTGRRFFAFQDVIANGLSSRYADWYQLREGRSGYGDAFAYNSWEGHEALPRLNLQNPEVREYIFGVARFWLGDVGIDGWRLDVAHEIAPSFWRDFARACKEVRPDCMLVGEVIHGDYLTWVGPDLLDSCTNYQLSKAIWSSLNDRNYFELAHCLMREMSMYPTLDALLNFVGNHDVPRLASKLKNPAHYYLAVTVLITMRGVPCLYYGDEVGMEGAPGGPDGDLAMRRPLCFDRSSENEERFAKTAALVKLRRSSTALAVGSHHHLANTNEQLSFMRKAEREAAVVILNCGAEAVPYKVDVSKYLENGTILRNALAEDGNAWEVKNGALEIGSIAACDALVLLSSN